MEKFLEQVEANEEGFVDSRDTIDCQVDDKAGKVGALPTSNAGDRLNQRRGTGYIAAADLEEALRQPNEESKQIEPPIIEKKNKNIVT